MKVDRVAHQFQFGPDHAVALVRDHQIRQPHLRLQHLRPELDQRHRVLFFHVQHPDCTVNDGLKMVHVVLSVFPKKPTPQWLQLALLLNPNHLALCRKPFVLPDHTNYFQLGEQLDECPIHIFFLFRQKIHIDPMNGGLPEKNIAAPKKNQ